jgi:hypothetical protein
MDDGSGEIIRAIAASQLGFRYEELRKATAPAQPDIIKQNLNFQAW